jgi:hypothetical protein
LISVWSEVGMEVCLLSLHYGLSDWSSTLHCIFVVLFIVNQDTVHIWFCFWIPSYFFSI